MAVLGLYDIDLWTMGKSYPNLELMKVYNYYYQLGNKVIMMTPKEEEGRFNTIIYFKDNPNTPIPRNLIISGANKKRYGYGFFNYFIPLLDKITETPPSYLPYDAYSEKLAVNDYELLKRSSYVRIENTDLTDYKKDMRNIFVADRDVFYLDNSYDFFLEYKRHDFTLFHQALCKDEETFNRFFRFKKLIRNKFYVVFDFSEEFFKEMIFEPVIYDWITNDNNEEIKKRILMALCYKIEKTTPSIFPNFKHNTLYNDIIQWARNKTILSFAEFFKDDREVMKRLDNAPSDIRVLLKYKPEKMKLSDISFKDYLK